MSRRRRPCSSLACFLLGALLASSCGGLPRLQVASPPTPVADATPSPQPSPSPSATPEPVIKPTGLPVYRALWVDAFHDGIKTKAQVDQLIARAHQGNLNTLLVQVRKRGDAYFNFGLESRADDPAVSPGGYESQARDHRGGFDPLAYTIARAHAANPPLEVHAWVNTFFVGKTSEVYRLHGAEWGNRRADGTDGGFGYLDPGSASVRAYTHDVFMELARQYPVDGIHLDFVRYPEGGDWGYTPEAVAAFNAATGASGRPDPNDPAWQQWRRDRVTSFVRNLHDGLAALPRRVSLSGALIAYGRGPRTDAEWRTTAAYADVFQDWNAWLRDGLLDFGIPMNYDRDSSPTEAGFFRSWTDWEKDHQGRSRVLIGIGNFDNYPEDSFNQVQRALQPSAAGNRALGIALYSYASTSLYGTDDFYLAPADQGYLPRQPYAPNPDPKVLAQRAAEFNNWFFAALSAPSTYTDPALGPVNTQPIFTSPAPIPKLP